MAGTPRTRFRRPADYLAAVAVVLVALAAGLAVWAKSDIRHTVSDVAAYAEQPPAQPDIVPATLHLVWQATSAATPVPVTVGPTIVTADSGQVLGRDPLTGAIRWRYARNLALCTVSSAWSRVIAVYRKSTNCSEVSSLDAGTGARGSQRNGNAQFGARLVSDGTYVTATGPTLLNTWRSDLVQTMEYGSVPDFNNYGRQPRPGCHYGSVAAGAGRIAVIERCKDDPGDRLTVFQAVAKDADTPSVAFSAVLPGTQARVVCVTGSQVAVALPDPARLMVYNAGGDGQPATYPLDLPASVFAGDPAGRVVPTAESNGVTYWWTGTSTIALAEQDALRPLWTVGDTLGPGTPFAGRLLMPVGDGLAVIDPSSGARLGTIAVNRDGYRGEIEMSSLGPVVLEQRGATIFALR